MKTTKIIAMATAMLSLALVSCTKGGPSDDEDGKNSWGVITTTEGTCVLLSEYSGYSYEYDLSGRPTRADNFVINYDTNELLDADDNSTLGTFKLDNKNNISEIQMSYNEDEGSEEMLYSFSYDNGRLSKSTINLTSSFVDGDDVMQSSMLVESVFTWDKAGNIVACVETIKETDSDGYNAEAQYNITFTCDSRNAVSQNAGTDIYYSETFEILYLVGLLGSAPANHPTKCYVTYTVIEDNESESGTYEFEFSYSYNNDGTISKESFKEGDYTWDRSYSYSEFTPTKALSVSLYNLPTDLAPAKTRYPEKKLSLRPRVFNR